MNPLLYNAHPLLWLTVDLIDNPKAHSLGEAGRLALTYLFVNLAWAPWLWLGVRKSVGFSLNILWAYVFALPAQILYLPIMLTLLGDVLAHEFHFSNRFILVFCVLIASQMLAAFYAASIRNPFDGKAIGMIDGLNVSLFMWLLSLPVGTALLGLNSVVKIF
jgi:hypothetical protein